MRLNPASPRSLLSQSMVHGRRPMVLIIIAVFASSTPAQTPLNFEFSEEEGFVMLEGQFDWIKPIPVEGEETSLPGAIVNTHDPGLGGAPGRSELIGCECHATRRSIPTVTGEATFTAWFEKQGNIPDDGGSDDFARMGNSGLQIYLGDEASLGANVEGYSIRILTRDSLGGRFIKYQRRNTGGFFCKKRIFSQAATTRTTPRASAPGRLVGH